MRYTRKVSIRPHCKHMLCQLCLPWGLHRQRPLQRGWGARSKANPTQPNVQRATCMETMSAFLGPQQHVCPSTQKGKQPKPRDPPPAGGMGLHLSATGADRVCPSSSAASQDAPVPDSLPAHRLSNRADGPRDSVPATVGEIWMNPVAPSFVQPQPLQAASGLWGTDTY